MLHSSYLISFYLGLSAYVVVLPHLISSYLCLNAFVVMKLTCWRLDWQPRGQMLGRAGVMRRLESLGICLNCKIIFLLRTLKIIFFSWCWWLPFKICLGELLQRNVSQEGGWSKRHPRSEQNKDQGCYVSLSKCIQSLTCKWDRIESPASVCTVHRWDAHCYTGRCDSVVTSPEFENVQSWNLSFLTERLLPHSKLGTQNLSQG